MATTYTSRAKIRKPGIADRGWNVPINENAEVLDAVNAIGGLAVTLAETPSASLDVAVAAGPYLRTWGQQATYAGTSSFACTASATNYLYLDAAGTLTKSTVGFPTSAAHIPLAVVVAGSSTITSITDYRTPLRMTIPNAQPTLGAATAGSTYTTAERDMINALWTMARALGLGT
jgi:hypothetical protein